ncbi:hypothetical protein TKK_0001119 [Trichogramma kaykai]|uniref:Uncharacterized protein n=1 Tax=Trichogramma kaykai TaxID=54128 RepID=A0ABD2WSC9_9HYME
MLIKTDNSDFVPQEFAILNFYGETVCFAWKGEEFVVFLYEYNDSSTPELNVLRAPSNIRDIRSYGERVFFLCHKTGIYKFNKNSEFSCVSKSGIEMGINFYEVFTIQDGYLCLDDKKQKTSKQLFTFKINITNGIEVLLINSDSTDESFYRNLIGNKCNNFNSLCLISHENKLYKLAGQNSTIQVMYYCDGLITGMKLVNNNSKNVGVILKTDGNYVIFINIRNNKLQYDKILLSSTVQSYYAVTDGPIFLLIYCDGEKTYYCRKLLTSYSIEDVRIENKHFYSFKLYKSVYVIFLNDQKEIFQLDIKKFKQDYVESITNFVPLEQNMLHGLDRIMAEIFSKTLQLQKLKEQVLEKEEQLKRINIFISKQNIKFCPDEKVVRMSEHTFLVSNFKKSLPKNSLIVKQLKNRGKTMFAVKIVNDFNTIVEMPVQIPNLSSKIRTSNDLISYQSDGGIWCLIRNYTRDPVLSKSAKFHLSSEKTNFVKHKLVVLREMMKDNKITMEALSKLKNELREQISMS